MTEETLQKKSALTPRRGTKVIRFLIPQIPADSPLLPTDKWVFKNFFDATRQNPKVAVGFGALTLFPKIASSVIFAAGAAALTGVCPPLYLGLGTLIGLGICGTLTWRAWLHFKKEALPELQKGMGKRYIQLKAGEIKAAWQEKLNERKRLRAEGKLVEKPKPAPSPSSKAPDTYKQKAFNWAVRKVKERYTLPPQPPSTKTDLPPPSK